MNKSFILKDSTIALLNDWFGVDMASLDFIESAQTGGYVMVDLYQVTGGGVLGVGEECACLYDSLTHFWDEDGTADYDETLCVDFDEDTYPDDDIRPALFMMAQRWPREKLFKVLSENTIPEDHLETIYRARTI